jgi:hypothetical protein
MAEAVSLAFRVIIVALVLSGSVADVIAQDRAAEESPLRISDRSCLFLDDRFIAQQSGLKRTWHQGQPRAESAIQATERWEKWPHLFGSVLFDPVTKLYKMWYEDLPGPGAVFYAESQDGKTWVKPKLELIELHGSRSNNCVLLPAELPNVFLDPQAADSASRFKMLAWCNNVASESKKWAGHVLWHSGDGIHWRAAGNFPLPETNDVGNPRVVRDTNQVAFDPLGSRYFGTFRTFPLHPGLLGWYRDEKYQMTVSPGGHRRGVGVSASKSLTEGWPKIVTVLQADDKDDAKVRLLSRGPEPDFAELYAMPFFTWGNHYLGVVSLLFQIDGMNDTIEGGGDLQLTFSHDGRTWHRQPDRQTLIARSPTKLVPVYSACNAPLELGDEMWLYYTEAESAHPKPHHKAFIRAAVWRRDGFVSFDAAERGTLTTKPFVLEGDRLMLNLLATGDGSVRAAIVDEAGRMLPGFDFSDCDPLRGDQVRGVLHWGGKSDLSQLKGRTVALKMDLSRCRLFSFRVSNSVKTVSKP